MDKQEAALKQVKGANVQRQGDKLVVKFDSAILFDTNRYDLKDASQHDLAEFAKVLVQYPETNLTIEGHTDNSGKKAHNVTLSKERAGSVATFLESQGVASGRMTEEGMGDSHPIADNTTADGRQQNRRVEIHINANEKLKQADAANAAQGQQAQPTQQQR
jgi:outer membrane protein OmpA-like peptidoglycan-associated protein